MLFYPLQFPSEVPGNSARECQIAVGYCETCLNPSNAEATFPQSTITQQRLKTI